MLTRSSVSRRKNFDIILPLRTFPVNLQVHGDGGSGSGKGVL